MVMPQEMPVSEFIIWGSREGLLKRRMEWQEHEIFHEIVHHKNAQGDSNSCEAMYKKNVNYS